MKTKHVTLAEVIAEAIVRADNHAETSLAFAAIGSKAVSAEIVALAKHHAEAGAKIASELFAAELREILFSQRPMDAVTPARLAALAGVTPADVRNNRAARNR